MTPRAIGYVRVSTAQQADGGVSLAAQRAKIEAMAAVQDADVVELIEDAGESAKSLERPGMARLLSLVDARAVDVVIVAKLDRLTRSVRDLADLLEQFERRGVALVSVAESLDTGSAAGRLMIHVLGAVAQWERETVSDWTRDALAHKRRRGERVGNVAYGFRPAADGLRVEPDADEQQVLADIRTQRSRGVTLRAIADELNRRGRRTRSGGAWRHEYVRNVLRSAEKPHPVCGPVLVRKTA